MNKSGVADPAPPAPIWILPVDPVPADWRLILPVPELILTAVAPVVFPIERVLALASVPRLSAPVPVWRVIEVLFVVDPRVRFPLLVVSMIVDPNACTCKGLAVELASVPRLSR